MSVEENSREPRILILSTIACAYPGADTAGQMHLDHPVNTYNVRLPSPAVLPEDFYFHSFEQGFDGIIIMSCGEECPYPGAYDRLAKRVDNLYVLMKEKGLNIKRLRLTAICTVCAQAYVKELKEMTEALLGHVTAKDVLAGKVEEGVA